MKEREKRWGRLNVDCLVEIFSKVEFESFVKHVPFVCKSWFNATRDPKCWTTLHFKIDVLYSRKFIKYVVNCGQRYVTSLAIPYKIPDQPGDKNMLIYISEKCPELKHVTMSLEKLDDPTIISVFIGRWKKLESLSIYSSLIRQIKKIKAEMLIIEYLLKHRYFKEILESVNIHCNNFYEFRCPDSYIGVEEASAIVEFLPKIKNLVLKGSLLSRENLVMILKGCRDLEHFDVSECTGFDPRDYEISQLSSHILSFNCNGSKFAEAALVTRNQPKLESIDLQYLCSCNMSVSRKNLSSSLRTCNANKVIDVIMFVKSRIES